MRVLVAGASGAIGAAIAEKLSDEGDQVLTISRSGEPSSTHLVCDLTSAESADQVSRFLAERGPVDAVFCCTGILHGGWNMPEKSLSQLTAEWLQQNMLVNVQTHIHLAQAVAPQVTRTAPIKWVSLSAMVGSIEDNGLGGWYSYRMSKAALNMFIRNLSIEWGRKAPGSVVVAQHPGTTESALSKPFQAGIADGKLYTQAQTAERLIGVMRGLNAAQNGRLLHWDGSVIPF
ncbi:SDR family NAD(P)-dependent oxidoreductase [uncultured Thalassolituus sp.]|uniref:SDR family NAD(P)-dependent oxidoreductase n=1 Tax=uncultured Thalassolituus sp. TaxID=285273 RepID=UPI0026205094|nr:SDR family NAD(P)-dependent oxidoreductase [uncultured Thalassolituus sp.]